MEQNKRLSVALKGIIKNKPAQFAEDGECEEIINLRYEDNAWRGVGMKELLPHNLVTLNYYDKVVRPAMLPAAHYIAYSAEEHAVFLLVGSSTEDADEHTLIELPEAETFRSFAWMNNSLIVYTSGNLYAFQYMPDKENASDMFIQLADLRMPKLAIGEQNPLEEVVWEGSITNLEENILTASQSYFESIRTKFFELYDEKRKDGLFFGNVSFFFAYKMFDGNYIKHSGPFAWNTAWDKTNKPTFFRSAYAGVPDPPPDPNPNPHGVAQWSMRVYLGKPTVYYEFIDGFDDMLQNYKDAGLIRSLCVFMSADRTGYNLFEAEIDKWTYSASPLPNYLPPFDAEAYKSLPDVSNHFLVHEIPLDDLIAAATTGGVVRTDIVLDRNQLASIETNENLPIDNFSAHKLIPGTHYLYNSRLHLGDINIIPGYMQQPFIDWFYDAVADEYILPYERDEYLPEDYMGGDKDIVEDNSTLLAYADLYLLAEVESEGKTHQRLLKLDAADLRLFSKTVEAVTTYYVCVRPLSGYPDMRAAKWMLLVNFPAEDNHLRICDAENGNGIFEMKPRTFSNTAIYNGSMQTTDEETYLPIWVNIPSSVPEYNSLTAYDSPLTHILNWHEPNRVQVSEVNNLFVYPAKQSYRIGNPDYTIRAMIVAQEPMTEMQFGQFPLYVFTAGGVFALEYAGGGEVLYSRITQFLTDIIAANVYPIALSGGAIVYQEENAVKVLIGRESKDISRQVLAESENPLYNQVHFITMVTDETVAKIREKIDDAVMGRNAVNFLVNSRIGYDSRTKEILFSTNYPEVFTGEKNYTLVYQLTSGAWYKRTEVYNDFIHSITGHLGLTRDRQGMLHVINLYYLDSEISLRAGDVSGMEYPWVFIQTRPMLLQSPFHKRIFDFVARFVAFNTGEAFNETVTRGLFGYLYDYFALESIAPAGFHILTLAEAQQIADIYDADALKEQGSAHWNNGNTGTNESLITLLGAGYRENDADFDGYREEAIIWLADEGDTGKAYAMRVTRESAEIVFEQLFKGYGLGVRMAMDEPELYTPGMTVQDRDGNIYDLVRVSREEVPFEAGNGLLYNWYAATDERNIAADGWEVPEQSDFNTLISYLGGYDVVGGKLKEVGTDYWNSPNGGATNEVGFNGRGAGIRRTDGLNSFDQIKIYLVIAAKDLGITEYPYVGFYLDYYSGGSDFYTSEINVGYSVRLIKTTTSLTHGQTGTYTGNDGKVYRTICIGDQEWLADNLCETKYRNGDYITGFNGGTYTPISNEAWAAATEGMVCAYNDELSNAFIGSPAINIVLTKQNWASTKYADGTDIIYAQEEEEWTDEATDGKFCNYDDAYVIDIPPVISGELSSWFAHVLKMGVVADIDPKNLATTVQLQYGATTAYGTTVELDVIDAGVTEAVVRSYIMPRLTPGTYHWRIVATNSAGTTTGDDQVFTVYPGTNREQTIYTLDTFTGTTYYIDPSAATNGTGTEASPYNAWPATIGGNNIYLQKCGTTAAFSGVFSTINGACKISSYGTGTLPRITCTQYDSADNFRFMRSDYKVLIQNMKIDKADITGLGIYLVNAPGSTVIGCDISGFSVPLYTQGGGTGLNVQWSGVKVLYCNIYSCGTDGLYFRFTTGIEVAHCYIYDVNRKFLISGMEGEQQSPGDNIQVASAGTTSINVHHCTLDHSTTGNKFNFIIASDNSVVSLVNNHFIGTKAFQGHPVSGVYLTAPCSFARIYGNIFENHNLGIYNGGANTRAAYNIFRNSNKCIATTNNRVISAVNNIFIDYLYNGLERLSGATLTAKNNVFKSDTGIAINLSGTGTQTIDFNHFEGQGALQSGTNASFGNTMFTSLVAGSENYYPLAGSPLINSGVNVDEDNDFDGQQVSTPPSKGIYE